VTYGSVVEFALDLLQQAIDAGVINPIDFREGPSPSTRAMWRLVMPENQKFFK
jgi:hypothetical protein